MRLDNYLVDKKLIQTRSKAQMVIKDGHVYVDGKCIKKNSYLVDDNNVIEIKG